MAVNKLWWLLVECTHAYATGICWIFLWCNADEWHFFPPVCLNYCVTFVTIYTFYGIYTTSRMCCIMANINAVVTILSNIWELWGFSRPFGPLDLVVPLQVLMKSKNTVEVLSLNVPFTFTCQLMEAGHTTTRYLQCIGQEVWNTAGFSMSTCHRKDLLSSCHMEAVSVGHLCLLWRELKYAHMM